MNFLVTELFMQCVCPLIDHHNRRNTVGMCGGELQNRRAPHAVTDGDGLTETQLLDEVRDVIRVGCDGVLALRLVALAMSA